MSRTIPRRSVSDLPEGWYPFSARPVLPALEAKVLSDLGDSWKRRLPETLAVDANRDPFALRTWPERLEEPLLWTEPKVVLVGGGADPFEGQLDPAYVRRIFKSMIVASQHVFVVLTGHIDRAALFLRASRTRGLPSILPPNITIGTPDGTTPAEHARVELLRQLPVRSRFAVTSLHG